MAVALTQLSISTGHPYSQSMTLQIRQGMFLQSLLGIVLVMCLLPALWNLLPYLPPPTWQVAEALFFCYQHWAFLGPCRSPWVVVYGHPSVHTWVQREDTSVIQGTTGSLQRASFIRAILGML